MDKSKLSEAKKYTKKSFTNRTKFLRKKVQEAKEKMKYLKQNRVYKI